MVFSFIFRLFSLLLLTVVSAHFAVDQAPEKWVGKKPSELMPDEFYESHETNFYEAVLNNGAISPFASWPYDEDKFIKIEHSVVRVGNYLVFWANDCGDKVCKDGFAFVYDMTKETRIVCEHERENDTRDVPDEDNTTDSDDPQYKSISITNDKLTYFMIERYRAGDALYPKIVKTGEGLSCGGWGGATADAEAIVRQLVWIENLITGQ